MFPKESLVEVVKGSHSGRLGVVRQSCVDYFDHTQFALVAVTIDERTYWFTDNQLVLAHDLVDPFDAITYDLDDVRAKSERYIGQWTGGAGLPVPIPKHAPLRDVEDKVSRLADLTLVEIFHKIFHLFRR